MGTTYPGKYNTTNKFTAKLSQTNIFQITVLKGTTKQFSKPGVCHKPADLVS